MNSNFLLAQANGVAGSNPVEANDDDEISDDLPRCGVCYHNVVFPETNIVDCCSIGKSLCGVCVVKMNGDNQVGSGKCPGCKRGFPFWLIEHFAALKLNDEDDNNHNHNQNQDDNNQAPQYVLGYVDEDGNYHVDDDDDDDDDDEEEEEDDISDDEVHFDRRIYFPCRNHFGRNGRQFLHGCTDIHCPYSHVQIDCRFGRGCERRHSCLFLHPV